MDRLHLMSVFVAVAEEESFAGGARRLNMSPPAVTRAIAALETRLNIKLFNRTTRFVRVTDAGRRYLEDCRRIISAADEADEAAAGNYAEPRGRLSITAPVLFGRIYVMPLIIDYLRQYPETSASAVLLDRVVNLLEEGFDLGIRIGELSDSSMHAVRVGFVHRVLCASPAYLAKHAPPQHPSELTRHSVIVSNAGTPTPEWAFANGVSVRIQPRLTVSHNGAAIEAAQLGFGITRLLSYQIAEHTQSGRLQTVLKDYEPDPLPIHVLYREGRQASAKVRTFVDLAAGKLRADPTLHEQG